MDRERRRLLLARFERASDIPLVALAFFYALLLVLGVLPQVPSTWLPVLQVLEWLVWALFAVDLAFRTALVERRIPYLLRNWLDVFIVVLPALQPLIQSFSAMPALRLLRVLRSTRVLTFLRLGRLAVLLARVGEGTRRLFRVHYLVLGAAGITVLLAILVYLAEKDAGGSINSVPLALWWGIVTIATVGYGDTFPVTAAGRGLAALLIIAGVALFSTLSATLAAWLMRGRSEVEERERHVEMSALEDRLDRLERLLQERLPASPNEREPTPRS